MTTVKFNVQSLTALGMSRTDIEALKFSLERAVSVEGATSSNEPGAIVQRDSSGNFSAGTITANLSGNATTSTHAATATHATTADAATTATTADNALQLGGVLAASYLQSSDIGVDVQAYDADLTAWAGKTAPAGVVVGDTDAQTLTNKTLTAAELGGATNVSGGQLQFPATQVPSADPNTLDDYEEGTFTPVLTFTTPGNLAVTYSSQFGHYTKVGRQVTVSIVIITSAFTHTTASGNLTITGLPFTSANLTGGGTRGVCSWGGITKAGYTQINSNLSANTTSLLFRASGSGSAISNVTFSDTPTGGTVNLEITHSYFTA